MADRADADPSGATATQPADTGDDDRTPTGETDDATLQERLAQAEAYIQELKGNQGSLLQKLETAATRVVELEGRVGEQRDILAAREPEKASEPDPWALDDARREEFQNAPDKIVEFTQRNLRRELQGLVTQIADVLDKRDGSIAGKIGQIEGLLKSRDPERQAYKTAVEELRKDEALADLPEEKLIAIAKKTGMKPDYEFSGGPGRPVQTATRSKGGDQRPEADIFAGFMGIYGDEARAKKATANYLKKQGRG
jgi:hypothetical protein